jgi:Ni,Fe-hydrogenase III large subunit
MSYRAVGGDHFRDAIGDGIARGARLASLYASADDHGPLVRAILCEPDGTLRIETVHAHEGRVPTVVDLTASAGWCEREAHDLHGIVFDGHEPLRPLVLHGVSLGDWTVPVHGADAYQVAVGPVHAGIIESGHFRFHVVGDRILLLDARLFYKHRGLERAAVGATLDDGIVFAARACGACAVTNRVAYAHAAEQLQGLEPEPEVARARTVLLELERLWSHLNDVSAICSGVGMAAGNQRFAALGEDARRLNHALTGHRLLFDSVHVGESRLTIDGHRCELARTTLARIQDGAARAWRSLLFNGSFQDRLIGVGVLEHAAALELGAVGPAARASGVREDARAAGDPRLAYEDLEAAIGERASGDVRARFEQRELELAQSFALLDTLLSRPIVPAVCNAGAPSLELAVSRVESPRGATICALERTGDRIRRLHLRTGSLANWPVVTSVAAGELLPDFPLINKSFELCYACADR